MDLKRYGFLLSIDLWINMLSAEEYNKNYFFSEALDGYEEFKRKEITFLQEKYVHYLEIKKGLNFLDICFGRGEMLYLMAKKGLRINGVDFSKDAFHIASKLLRTVSKKKLVIADARQLPFPSNSFDRLLSSDVLEHLEYDEGVLMLKEMWRVLKPNGIMLIHTMPNNLFVKYIYSLIRPFLNLIDTISVDRMDRQLIKTKKYHLHEYNLLSLKKIANNCCLKNVTVWIDKDVLRSGRNRHTKTFVNNYLIKLVVYL
ncbi:MAG: class I SAM-dependent methyltransferase, partial [Nanoarchaeota archaeon]|nr:class I SAM-dependent methyltransferase [Nanoarchaeota archaeon]